MRIKSLALVFDMLRFELCAHMKKVLLLVQGREDKHLHASLNSHIEIDLLLENISKVTCH